jgi:hypothetical protein
MSEINLLAFGCAVTFIAAAGVYVYARERFTLAAQRTRSRRRDVESAGERLRDVA